MSKKVDSVVVTRSLRGGHFRATMRHDKEETPWPSGTFTEEQLELLRADPDLEVRVLSIPVPKDEGEGAPAGDDAKKDKKKD